jgi:hypothetical protein
VRFVSRSLTSSFLALHLRWGALLRWLRVYGLSGLLLVAWRRRRVLSRLLLALRWVLIALLPGLLLVVRQRLAVGAFRSVSKVTDPWV